MLPALGTTFRQETPPGLRLDCTDPIKELDSTCVKAHQREAPTDTADLVHPTGIQTCNLRTLSRLSLLRNIHSSVNYIDI